MLLQNKGHEGIRRNDIEEDNDDSEEIREIIVERVEKCSRSRRIKDPQDEKNGKTQS